MSKHGKLLLLYKRGLLGLMKLLEALNRIHATMCDTNCKMSNASQVVSLVHMLHTGTIQTQMFSHWM